jgi:hypothetical protein
VPTVTPNLNKRVRHGHTRHRVMEKKILNGKTVRIPFCVRREFYICPQHLLSSNKEVLRPRLELGASIDRSRQWCRCTTGGPLGSGTLRKFVLIFGY